MPLSRLYAMVSTSPLRTVTLCPTACETSVSAAVAPPARAALEHRLRRCARARRWAAESVRPRARRAGRCGILPGGLRGRSEGAAVIDEWLFGRRDGWALRQKGRAPAVAPRRRQGVGYHSKAPDAISRPDALPLRISARTMPRPDELQPRRRGMAAMSEGESPDAGRPPSKSQRKRDMHALQDLGETLVELDPRRLADLAAEVDLPERLVEAIVAARGDHGLGRAQAAAAVRRQADARASIRRRSGARLDRWAQGHDIDVARQRRARAMARAAAGRARRARRTCRGVSAPRPAAHCARSIARAREERSRGSAAARVSRALPGARRRSLVAHRLNAGRTMPTTDTLRIGLVSISDRASRAASTRTRGCPA